MFMFCWGKKNDSLILASSLNRSIKTVRLCSSWVVMEVVKGCEVTRTELCRPRRPLHRQPYTQLYVTVRNSGSSRQHGIICYLLVHPMASERTVTFWLIKSDL